MLIAALTAEETAWLRIYCLLAMLQRYGNDPFWENYDPRNEKTLCSTFIHICPSRFVLSKKCRRLIKDIVYKVCFSKCLSSNSFFVSED